jgi:hypothetical protein
MDVVNGAMKIRYSHSGGALPRRKPVLHGDAEHSEPGDVPFMIAEIQRAVASLPFKSEGQLPYLLSGGRIARYGKVDPQSVPDQFPIISPWWDAVNSRQA